MKRRFSLLLLLCMVLATLPAMAENEFYGNMEIVNCKEWVSLRAEPRTSAERITKVPLGAVVTQCQQHSKGWVCAVYDGSLGYIQDKYLRICEGLDVCSAMLVTGCGSGTDFYAAVGDPSPDGFIPANTLLRNCAVLARGRTYAEFGARSIYLDAAHTAPYTGLEQYPAQFTLHQALFAGAYEGPAPVLRADDAAAFPLAGYEYSTFDYPASTLSDADTPRAAFVLHADTAVTNVHLFSVSLRSVDMEAGEAVYDFTLEHRAPQVDPAHPLAVTAVIYGDTPNLAVGYEDWTGAYHFAFVEISGEDGSLLLREF